MSSNLPKYLLVLLTLIALSISYWALNTRCTFRFREVPTFVNYDMLAEAFSQGQLHLREAVHPGRLQAADPAHPGLPYPYLRDAVIFQGKYYFLQEPLPGAFHLIWMKVTGLNLPTGASIIAVALGCFLMLGVVLRLIRSHCFQDTPPWLAWVVWISFGVSGSQLYIVSRPIVYHETIVWGTFFTLCATALFFRVLFQSRSGVFTMLVCSLFCVLAVLCRVTFVTYAASFGLGFALTSFIGKRTLPEVGSRLVVFAIPLLCCVGLLLVYNYVRFGDVLDFGRSRVIIPMVKLYEYCCLGGKYFSIDHVVPNLQIYLFELPEVTFRHIIPWVRFAPPSVSVGDVFVTHETIASLFIMMPILIAAAPLALLPGFRAESGNLVGSILTCSVASLTSFAVFVPLVTGQARYLYEFTPLAFPVVYYNVAMVWRKVENRGAPLKLTVISIIALLTVNGIMGLYLGLNGMVQWR